MNLFANISLRFGRIMYWVTCGTMLIHYFIIRNLQMAVGKN